MHTHARVHAHTCAHTPPKDQGPLQKRGWKGCNSQKPGRIGTSSVTREHSTCSCLDKVKPINSPGRREEFQCGRESQFILKVWCSVVDHAPLDDSMPVSGQAAQFRINGLFFLRDVKLGGSWGWILGELQRGERVNTIKIHCMHYEIFKKLKYYIFLKIQTEDAAW